MIHLLCNFPYGLSVTYIRIIVGNFIIIICWVPSSFNMPASFEDILNNMPTSTPRTLIFEDDDDSSESSPDQPSVLQCQEELLPSPPPPVSPPPVVNDNPFDNDDPFDADQMAMILADFYEDLRRESTFWVRIRVKFFSPRMTFQNLCQSCCDRFLYSYNAYVYYDFVSYHYDCYRDGYFCAFCRQKLYTIVY